ncbi:MAG: histidine--tRNA ligase [Bifidobacteriaceae bacterium]|jgi:histidyl-tRNA synthetase|nr:histidine--tRNA ligase [Bifidobacteriaceae bacterium]
MKISGFKQFSPQLMLIEKNFLQIITEVFEVYGFQNIEPRAAQRLEDLLAKGETSKEIYLINRLQSINDNRTKTDLTKSQQLGLRFDHTIPLRNYILEFANDINFPFRAYQIGKVWRGERAQAGRFREFNQADIDIVSNGELPAISEIDCILAMNKIFTKLSKLGCPPIEINLNSRQIVQAFYQFISLTQIDKVLGLIDKIDKVGSETIADELIKNNLAKTEQIDKIFLFLNLTKDIKHNNYEQDLKTFQTEIIDENTYNQIAKQLQFIYRLKHLGVNNIKLNFKIARGLDYYTGIVLETFLNNHTALGSICSGGRYDKLISQGKTTYQGIGLSIGITRLIDILQTHNLLSNTPQSYIDILVILDSETSEDTQKSLQIAEALRQNNNKTIISPKAWKYGKQIEYANKLGIKYVWFNSQQNSNIYEGSVKNIINGQQISANAKSFAIRN